MSERLPVLYLAPWVGYGGSDKNTIDWFRWLDRERFAPYLITTQPSANPLLREVEPYAEEVWVLPELMPADAMPAFILDFVRTRGIRAIHLMNSKLGFDLLPELAELPGAPAVVVQMHAEEVDRSGYVRYVSTRLRDHVACFSLSNEHVASALREYGVPEEKIRVIYTGADAGGEFDPATVEPAVARPDERLQILFAARLVDQKDPLLMVEVAAALREAGAPFRVNVVGEGDLEDQVRARIAVLGLEDEVVLHGPASGLRGWYPANDVLLLTSTFEGIPVVLFEAMAMGLPIVTPGLPAIREMLGAEEEGVVEPRDRVADYVEPLARLARDRDHLAARSAAMRERALGHFTVQQMAAEHGALYEEVTAGRPTVAPPTSLTASALKVLAPAPGDGVGLAMALDFEDGPLIAVTEAGEDTLGAADPMLVEKLARRFTEAPDGPDAIVFADLGPDARFAGSILGPTEGGSEPAVHTIAWRRDFEPNLPSGLRVDPVAPASSLAWLFGAAGARIEWRHLATPGTSSAPPHPPGEDSVWLRSPRAPAPPPAPPERSPWVPRFSTLVARHRRPDGGHTVGGLEPPAECEREHLLGAIRDREFAGTTPFEGLGRLEVAPLPGLDSLAQAIVRETGEVTVVSLPEDPLLPEVEIGEHLGFLDPVPPRPRDVPFAERPIGLVGLLTAVDQGARRHRAALGEVPPGEGVFELGAASTSKLGGRIPIWIEDGVLVTGPPAPPGRPPLLVSARWAVAPLSWDDLGATAARAKVGGRRALTALRRLRRQVPDPAPQGEPHAWLFDRPGLGMLALFAATHPVTGDQLLTRDLDLVARLGYGPARHLGFLRALAPVTGDLAEHPVATPWLHRFGHVPRSA
ncbi:MAG TPA: glycosyltransferase family 4 protein [Solirubrobacterales bacterium]|nr:glycosyltransferase family 4 protein [Solirubrobacterales bacterium]